MARWLHLLLAPKERFEPEGAGAFALNVLETSLVSRYRDAISVFGSPVKRPFHNIRFEPLAKARWWEGDRNRTMARRYVKRVGTQPPDLVEVYNRPVMIDLLRRGLGTAPIALHFGNDPRTMDGSRSAAQRLRLLEQTTAIVCVSDFVRRCFLDGIEHPLSARVHVIHTGVPRGTDFSAKENRIIYVGRVIPEKGVLELVRALARVLPRYPQWSAEIIGARWFGSGKMTAYENSVAQAASSCDRIALAGFKPHEDVLASLRRAAIAVVPSLWDDPFPRTALEALAQGCALICSARGGLPELGAGSAYYLESISADSLGCALRDLIENEDHRDKLHRGSQENFAFDILRATAELDDLREKLMSQP